MTATWTSVDGGRQYYVDAAGVRYTIKRMATRDRYRLLIQCTQFGICDSVDEAKRVIETMVARIGRTKMTWTPKMTRDEYWARHSSIYSSDEKSAAERDAEARALHREFYAQFVDDAYIAAVVGYVGAQRLLASTNRDGCFNDIGLRIWDTCPWPHDHRRRMKQCGTFPATFPVCEAKEAARQWLEREVAAHTAASLEYNRSI